MDCVDLSIAGTFIGKVQSCYFLASSIKSMRFYAYKLYCIVLFISPHKLCAHNTINYNMDLFTGAYFQETTVFLLAFHIIPEKGEEKKS